MKEKMTGHELLSLLTNMPEEIAYIMLQHSTRNWMRVTEVEDVNEVNFGVRGMDDYQEEVSSAVSLQSYDYTVVIVLKADLERVIESPSGPRRVSKKEASNSMTVERRPANPELEARKQARINGK